MTDKTTDKKQVLSPKERRQRNREEVTESILDAARAIMREEGVAALNLNEVARRVGMKTPSLYEYFPNKMAIYDRLFLLGVRLFQEHMGALSPSGDPWEMIEAAFRRNMEFAQKYPELFQLVFERHIPHFEPSAETMKESWAMLATVGQALQEIIQSGFIRSDLPLEQVRDLFIALNYGLTAQHMANEPHLPVGSGRYGSLIPAAVEVLRKALGADDKDS